MLFFLWELNFNPIMESLSNPILPKISHSKVILFTSGLNNLSSLILIPTVATPPSLSLLLAFGLLKFLQVGNYEVTNLASGFLSDVLVNFFIMGGAVHKHHE